METYISLLLTLFGYALGWYVGYITGRVTTQIQYAKAQKRTEVKDLFPPRE